MKTTPTKTALALLASALCVLVVIARIEEHSAPKAAASPESGPYDLCVGVHHGKSGTGLVCAKEPDQIMKRAVSRLNLPSKCLEVKPPSGMKNGDKIILTESGEACVLDEIATLPGGSRLMVGGLLNVNRDCAADLALLPGIGEVKARRIVEEREERGRFEKLEDLKRVPGIGDVTAERLGPWLEWE